MAAQTEPEALFVSAKCIAFGVQLLNQPICRKSLPPASLSKELRLLMLDHSSTESGTSLALVYFMESSR